MKYHKPIELQVLEQFDTLSITLYVELTLILLRFLSNFSNNIILTYASGVKFLIWPRGFLCYKMHNFNKNNTEECTLNAVFHKGRYDGT